MTRTPEEELLILACLVPLTEGEAARLRTLAAAPGLDWPLVGELAALNKVEPRLRTALHSVGAWNHAPEAVGCALTQAAEAVAATNQKRVARAEVLFAAFHAAGIEFCLLKGMLFAETLYQDPLYKRMNDIDMLVHIEDVPRITEIYAELGYFSIAERVANRPDLNKKVSHHLPPYVSRELDCLLGTQWGLKSPRAGLQIDYPGVWSRIEPELYHGLPIHKLSSRDNLFHVCIHLGVFKTGLRDLMDIVNLIRQESGRIDWAAFVADARAAHAQSLVVHALTLVNALDPRPETAAALAGLSAEASGFYVNAAKTKTASTAVLLRTCSGHLSTVEKAVSAYNVARYFPEKVTLFGEFWRSVLAPPPAERQRVCFVPNPTPAQAMWARIVAPVQLLRAIGAEVGNGLVAMLLLKSTIDLAVSFARWPFTRRADNDLAAYARGLGLSLADLERIKDGIY
ncbi:hypothetical protein LBMAG42_31360 [Deltaproteobacteria bacterium]|nr:hypothetical protein LBMAG42_31360 [Deltaproteobacteria bacterium]